MLQRPTRKHNFRAGKRGKVSSSNERRPDAADEMADTAHLLYELGLQMARFGPSLATRMSISSTLSLPWGLGVAGAESVKQGVDAGDPEGVGRLTAIMVRLGMLGMVHDIVVTLCGQDRHDAVGAVTLALLQQGEIPVVTQITNSLIASGHTTDAVTISGQLIKQGNTQILGIIKDTGLEMGGGLLSGDGAGAGDKQRTGREEDKAQDGAYTSGQDGDGRGVVDTIMQQTAEVVDRIIPPAPSSQAGNPNAEALFSDWTGVKAPNEKSNEKPNDSNHEKAKASGAKTPSGYSIDDPSEEASDKVERLL